MSTVGELRSAIRSALTALPGMSGVMVTDAPTPEHAWEAARNKPCVVLCYGGKKKAGAGGISIRDTDDFVYVWHIVVVADCYQPEGSTDAVYAAEEIAEKVSAIRSVKLGLWGGEPVYLGYAQESWIVPPNRPLEGGEAGVIQTYETTQVRA